MTRSTISLATSAEDHRIARLAALAIGLALVDAAIPSPLPGVKPGLANIVVLLVLHRHGFAAAAWVSLLRVVAGSLILGSFLSPSFVLSLSGALASLLSLNLACRLPARWFGPVSHSILAAIAHLAAQLGVVGLWLIPFSGLAYLAPFFAAAALLFGTVNGLVAARLLQADEAPLPAEEAQAARA
ncbi:MAG: Gx transporter family protein [Burkholderiales bacterium]